jgi:SNF2 family DNA or RNA helicase
MLPDLSEMPEEKRKALAELVRTSKDFDLPDLKYFNSQPCQNHASVAEGQEEVPPCRACGVVFRKHQRVGIAWLYLAKKALLADFCGSGKSFSAAGLLAAIKETGELDGRRALIVMRSIAIGQWQSELRRAIPDISVSTAIGTRKQRVEKYLQPWDVMLISYQMLLQDLDSLRNFDIAHLIVDDVDTLRSRDNKSALAIKQIAANADRVVVMTATPLQKRLHELYAILETVGGREVLGTDPEFRRTYVDEEVIQSYNPKTRRYFNTTKIRGYHNLDEFKEKISPLVLRRTAADIDDVDLPAVIPGVVYLDLTGPQRQKYDELRRGVLKLLTEGTRVKPVAAAARFMRGQQICSGLSALGEEDSSAKLDWLEDKLVDGDLSEDKVVVFIQFKAVVAALQERLKKAGVGNVTIWGEDNNAARREESRSTFWNDPNCKVLIGTSSIMQSLNLQVARHLVCVDTLMNAASMQQLAGRIRRDGSAFKSVYVHQLLASGTQEDGYLDLLRREQGLADFVHGETNSLFESLSGVELLQLVGGSK